MSWRDRARLIDTAADQPAVGSQAAPTDQVNPTPPASVAPPDGGWRSRARVIPPEPENDDWETLAKKWGSKALKAVSNPMGLPGEPLYIAKKLPEWFNKGGEKTAETLAENGAEPHVAALAGTGVSMIPDVAQIAIDPPLAAEQAAVKLAPKVGEDAPLKMRPVAQKFLSSILGPNAEAVGLRLNRPEALKSARPYAELADEMASTANKLSGDISEADKNAWATLNTSPRQSEGGLDKRILRSKIDELIRQTELDSGGVVGASKAKARQALQRMRADIDAAGPTETLLKGNKKGSRPSEFLSEADFKGIINSADQDIDWEQADKSVLNGLLRQLRGSTGDVLTNVNPKYEMAMEPVSRKTRALKDVESKFGLKEKPGDGYVPTDATASKLAFIGDEKKGESHRILDAFAKETGRDFRDESSLYRAKEQFQPGKTRANGSRRVNIGRAVGTGVAGVPAFFLGEKFGGLGGGLGLAALLAHLGEAAGGTVGGYLDSEGGDIAGRLLDRLSQNPDGSLARIATSRIGRAPSAGAESLARSAALAEERALNAIANGSDRTGRRR